MEKDSTGSAEKTEPGSVLRENIHEDNCTADSFGSQADNCGTTDVARARWTLLRQVSRGILNVMSSCLLLSQVLRQKQTDSPEVKQVSVRRFSTFDLFSRKRLVAHSDTSDDQWVEYRSVFSPEYSALLRYTHLNGLNEVLNSFDNTGNVCK
uniref:Uncharacterized protein n=1 Tax=Stegastes partitus TaxID=144197 RepID=A0A3B5B666_9TELE